MGDHTRRRSQAESRKVIACANPANILEIRVPCDVLSMSPVLKGWLQEPDTTPAAVRRYGTGTLTLNTEREVAEVLLEYLRQAHVEAAFKLESENRGAVFLVQLYKLALSLGLNHLCIITMRNLCSQTRNVDDFAKVALEASQWGLIDEERFRSWFIGYIHQWRDELLNRLVGDSDEMKFCRLLVSALALAKDDFDRRSPGTPSSVPSAIPSSSSRRRSQYRAGESCEMGPSTPFLENKATPSKTTKSSRYHATVEEAMESDKDDPSAVLERESWLE